jgi:hypothetical protein
MGLRAPTSVPTSCAGGARERRASTVPRSGLRPALRLRRHLASRAWSAARRRPGRRWGGAPRQRPGSPRSRVGPAARRGHVRPGAALRAGPTDPRARRRARVCRRPRPAVEHPGPSDRRGGRGGPLRAPRRCAGGMPRRAGDRPVRGRRDRRSLSLVPRPRGPRQRLPDQRGVPQRLLQWGRRPLPDLPRLCAVLLARRALRAQPGLRLRRLCAPACRGRSLRQRRGRLRPGSGVLGPAAHLPAAGERRRGVHRYGRRPRHVRPRAGATLRRRALRPRSRRAPRRRVWCGRRGGLRAGELLRRQRPHVRALGRRRRRLHRPHPLRPRCSVRHQHRPVPRVHGPGERCDEWLCRSDLLCVDGVCTPPAWQVCP